MRAGPSAGTGPGEPEGAPLPAMSRPIEPAPIDLGRIEAGRVRFQNWRGAADRPEPPPPAPLPPHERVGVAVVGLGRLALGQILPALVSARGARLAGLVSGRPEKMAAVGMQYGVPVRSQFGPQEWERVARDPDIRAVYIVTPNGMHRDQVLAAAAAGKHVLCEKPMANTAAEAREMIVACRDAGVTLMIAYRCQYERLNRRAIDIVRSGQYGAPRLIEACNTQVQGAPDQWRMRAPLAGGGVLPDIGIYCLNGARAYTGEEPEEVYAQIRNPVNDTRFAEVEDTIAFMLRFPSGVIAQCAASYTAHESKDIRVRLERGWIEVADAFAYKGQSLRVARRVGDEEAVETIRVPFVDQFALELEHFADCVRTARAPRTPGEEGLQDHVIMEALYESARTRRPVGLQATLTRDAFRGPALGA